jgi:hypothetical protein
MDVELPPDVASGGESGVDVETDVELPPSVGDDDEPPLSTPCCCGLKCWAKFDMALIEGQREQIRLTSAEDRRAAMFQAVRGHVCNADGTMNEGRINWQTSVSRASCLPEPAAGMDTVIGLAVSAQGHETSCLRVEVTLSAVVTNEKKTSLSLGSSITRLLDHLAPSTLR